MIPSDLPFQANVSSGASSEGSHAQGTVGQSAGEPQQSVFNADTVLPNVNSLRQNPSIFSSVHYNTTDTITSIPELRWPSVGCHNSSGKKRTVHDDLSLPEWAVGQLDPVIVKKALL